MTIKVCLTQHTDVFRNPGQTFTLTAVPSDLADVSVYLNGLLMLEGLDYTLSGSALTFTGQQIEDTPVIQVKYSTATVVE